MPGSTQMYSLTLNQCQYQNLVTKSKFSLQQNQKYGEFDHLGNFAWPDKSTICQSLSDRIKLVSALWKYQKKAAVIWISDQKLGKIQAYQALFGLKWDLSQSLCAEHAFWRTRYAAYPSIIIKPY